MIFMLGMGTGCIRAWMNLPLACKNEKNLLIPFPSVAWHFQTLFCKVQFAKGLADRVCTSLPSKHMKEAEPLAPVQPCPNRHQFPWARLSSTTKGHGWGQVDIIVVEIDWNLKIDTDFEDAMLRASTLTQRLIPPKEKFGLFSLLSKYEWRFHCLGLSSTMPTDISHQHRRSQGSTKPPRTISARFGRSASLCVDSWEEAADGATQGHESWSSYANRKVYV